MTAMARTLLIVDDHAGFRAFARALLEAEGYDVLGEAADGESALAAVAALDPEVVLLDVALPDIDGFAVCARLLALDRDRPAVVLTSSRDASSYGQRLAGSGARGFVPKSDLSGPRRPDGLTRADGHAARAHRRRGRGHAVALRGSRVAGPAR
jgi:DNA-binding NarL/FixJ family response regulator